MSDAWWRVEAQIVQFKSEEDSDIHLILFDKGHYRPRATMTDASWQA
jgi:hypothetical protein